MTDDASQRLDELKLLWESDPSSKVYLQLASAYRQAGQLDHAVEVLETSLRHRPRDPRGRVALARCKMELDDPSGAAQLLEGVIRQDAAHLEANKKLLECYLLLGDTDRAEERLNIYRLLNDRDPELSHLEYRLTSLKDGGASAESTDPVQAATPEPAVASEPAVAPKPEPSAPDGVDAEPAASGSTPETPAFEFEPIEDDSPGHEAPRSDTGRDKHRTQPDLGRLGLSIESIGSDEAESMPESAVPEPAVPEPAVPKLAAAEQPTSEPPAEAEQPSPTHDSAEAQWELEPTDPPAEESDAAPVIEEEVQPSDEDLFDEPTSQEATGDLWGGDLFDLASPTASTDPDLEGLWEQTEVVDSEPEEAEEGQEVEQVGAPRDDSDSGAEAASDSADEEDGETETATLGLLYLKQGHLDEAEAIFQRVLAQEEDNEAALAGLEQLEIQRLAAGALEAEVPPEGDVISPQDSDEAPIQAVPDDASHEPVPPTEPDPAPGESETTDDPLLVAEEEAPEVESEPQSTEPEVVPPASVPTMDHAGVEQPQSGEPAAAAAADHQDTPEQLAERPEESASVETEPAGSSEPSADADPENQEHDSVGSERPVSSLTAQALLERAVAEGASVSDATDRKIAVLEQYIQQIRTASEDHVH
ncbi:MAG: tetratricopeptide repeat protein [Thermoanaerobaculia bacterium]|nr:tetratricopeptide repeat protein [Thermoanaerobaculia bacterium]